jgi:hypothetical protein
MLAGIQLARQHGTLNKKDVDSQPITEPSVVHLITDKGIEIGHFGEETG